MKNNRVMVSIRSILVLSILVSMQAFAMEKEAIEPLDEAMGGLKLENHEDRQQPSILQLIEVAKQDNLDPGSVTDISLQLVVARAQITDYTQKLQRIVRMFEEALGSNSVTKEIVSKDKEEWEGIVQGNASALEKLDGQLKALPEEANSVQVLTESIFGDSVTVEQDAANDCFKITRQIRDDLKRQHELRTRLIPGLQELFGTLDTQFQGMTGRELAINNKLETYRKEMQEQRTLKEMINQVIIDLNEKYKEIIPNLLDESVLNAVRLERSYVFVENQPGHGNEEKKQEQSFGCEIL